MRKLSNINPTSKVAKCLAIVVALFLLTSFASLTVQGGTAYTDAEDRYVLLNGDMDNGEGSWSANIQLNLTIPKEIGTRSSLDGTITYNMSQSANNLSSVSPAFYANTTVDVQGETVYANETFEFQENDTEYTRDITVDLSDADLNESDDTNDTLTATFETESNTEGDGSDLSTSDSISLEVKLVQHVSYVMESLVNLIISIIPLIIVVFVLGIVMKTIRSSMEGL